MWPFLYIGSSVANCVCLNYMRIRETIVILLRKDSGPRLWSHCNKVELMKDEMSAWTVVRLLMLSDVYPPSHFCVHLRVGSGPLAPSLGHHSGSKRLLFLKNSCSLEMLAFGPPIPPSTFKLRQDLGGRLFSSLQVLPHPGRVQHLIIYIDSTTGILVTRPAYRQWSSSPFFFRWHKWTCSTSQIMHQLPVMCLES